MDTEYSPVEFIIVQRLPSPRITGGNDATVGCFKDNMNIQTKPWVTVLFVVGFVLHYACAASFCVPRGPQARWRHETEQDFEECHSKN